MFVNLKKKLKGFFKKAEKEIEVEEKIVEEPVEEPKPVVEPKVSEKAVEVEEVVKVEEKEPEVIEEPVVEEAEPEVIEEPEIKEPEIEKVEPKVEEVKPEIEKPPEPEKPKKKLGLLRRVTKKHVSKKGLDKVLWDLELALLENDVAKEVTEAICSKTKENLLQTEAKGNLETVISNSLKKSLESILGSEKVDVLNLIKLKKEKPFTIVFFGFNGSGKTLTIGKFAKLLKAKGLSVVFAAGDTFRAAAIEQLEEHAKALEVTIIKQKRGSDAAAVIYDAIEHAKSKGIDVVLADTAGRSHTDINLMDELKKVVRVNKPDLKIFVGDSMTGNDAADQAKSFSDAVGIDASVLTKADCDAKGGACISVAYVTGKPILYLGTGQGYGDMQEFEAEWFLSKVF